MKQAYVGRQPVYDRGRNVVGYELLFRPGDQMTDLSGDEMTSRVMVHACIDFGLANLVGDKPAFVNMTRRFLVGEVPLPFTRRDTVLEVLEDIVVDDEVLEGLRRHRATGHKIALDDFAFAEENLPLLDVADYVKVDVLSWRPEELPALVQQARDAGCKVVAERVETNDHVAACMESGFDLFQGYALARPAIITGAQLDASRMHCLHLLTVLSQNNVGINEVDELVRRDAGLTYRVLRAANSAAIGTSRRVRSVREAIVLLGLRQLHAWVMLMLIADDAMAVPEQVVDVMTRARFCELLARQSRGANPGSAFTVGLLSKLPHVLGMSMGDVLIKVNMHSEIRDALTSHAGPLGSLLAVVERYENDQQLSKLPAQMAQVSLADTYMASLSWSRQVTTAVA